MPNAGANHLGILLRPPPTTAARVARMCGVSRQAVTRWRAGTATPNEKHRELLRATFGIPIEAWDELVEGKAVSS
jgi:transcriptional regulator with XRE-family HTH domain